MVRTGRGQAAVESVAVTVAVALALLVAALAAWTAGNVRPAGPPPDAIGHLADPLGAAARRVEQAWSRDDLPSWLDTAARGRGDRPIGRFLGGVRDGALDAVGLAVAFDEGWRSGIRPVVRRRVEAFIDDPWGSVTSGDLRGTAVGLIHRAGRLPDYIRMLSRMPPREAARRLGHDLGETTGEVGFDVLEAMVQRRLGGAARGGRAPAPPGGGRDAPRP